MASSKTIAASTTSKPPLPKLLQFVFGGSAGMSQPGNPRLKCPVFYRILSSFIIVYTSLSLSLSNILRFFSFSKILSLPLLSMQSLTSAIFHRSRYGCYLRCSTHRSYQDPYATCNKRRDNCETVSHAFFF